MDGAEIKTNVVRADVKIDEPVSTIDLAEFLQDENTGSNGLDIIARLASFYPKIDAIELGKIKTYHMPLGFDHYQNLTPLDGILGNIARQCGYIIEDRSPHDPQKIGNVIYFKVQVLRVNGFESQRQNISSQLGNFFEGEKKRLEQISRRAQRKGVAVGHDIAVIDCGREKIIIATSMARKYEQA